MPLAEVLAIGVKDGQRPRLRIVPASCHRDVKPSNILITPHSACRCWQTSASSSSLASQADEQVLAMSVPWSAPEVLTEQTSGTVASEVWGLGATVYSLLAGHSPFERMEPGQNARDR